MYAVQPLQDVRQLECSAFAFAAILKDGKVVTWGRRWWRQFPGNIQNSET